jgi:hypothetical protein
VVTVTEILRNRMAETQENEKILYINLLFPKILEKAVVIVSWL